MESSFATTGSLAVSCGPRLLTVVAHSSTWAWVLRHVGSLSSCSSCTPEHRLRSCGAQGLAALRHMGPSGSGANPVSCIGGQILDHWATRGSSSFICLQISFYQAWAISDLHVQAWCFTLACPPIIHLSICVHMVRKPYLAFKAICGPFLEAGGWEAGDEIVVEAASH